MMPNTFINLRRRLQRGMTFIELIVSIVIVGIAVSGVLLVMNMTTGRSADPMLREQAVLIAESYMEEILAQKFVDPDTNTVCPVPEAGLRSAYDNACDYHNLTDNGCNSTSAGACDRRGNTISGLEAYNVTVNVFPNRTDTTAAVDLNGLTNDYPNGYIRVLRIEVRVTHDDVPDIDAALTAYRTNYVCNDTTSTTTCRPLL